jgi:hypothetical protein
MRNLLVSWLAASVVGSFVLLANPREAHAQQYYYVRPQPVYGTGLNIGVDLEGAADVTPPPSTDVEGGGGVKLRLGVEFRRPWLRIIPEAGFGYTHLFIQDPSGANVGWNMERLFVGARIGFGELIVPVLYGHIGYGWRATEDDNGGVYIPSASGLTVDGGVALDFHLVRHFGFGLHLEYTTVQAAPAIPDWVAAGVHGDYRF